VQAAFVASNPDFAGYEQHDASEFLSAFVDRLAEDLNQGSALPRSRADSTYRMKNGGETPLLVPVTSAATAVASSSTTSEARPGSPLSLGEALPPPAEAAETAAAEEAAVDEGALAREAWRAHVARNRSLVADLFQGLQV
jgi:hypothetical protein